MGGVYCSGIIRLPSGNETVKAHLGTARHGKWCILAGDRRYEERIDWIMGLVTFAGAAVGLLFPFVLILLGVGFYFPNLELLIVGCQVTGCGMVVIGLVFFICRKEV